MSEMTPREIVSELDKHIIGQDNAKRSVAIALRNRWRRMQLNEELRHEVTPKNILMIGMPASGKSTIGVLLAKRLGYSFVDVDLVIQEKTGKLLKEIIAEEGDDGFLRVEEQANLELDVEKSVIAPGGSVIYEAKAMEHYKETATIVYLKLRYEDLESRLGNLVDRGVVLKDGMTLRDLYNERLPYYEKYADITLDETGKEFGELVDELRAYFENLEK